ncbi:GNAT family N-acetyltransferase [Mangrovibacterium diazotrophicum]|uniref:Acetyltransferase (GNAT) family protein n=1 Tax=Mangrovibacterium diazotrophicum TaxID=1261403 RepID=A0A419VX21_9BACT|nr:GNAT family N-acetyltransferase [Mangrovibacterium diazotrophicum]RKD87781.1 acetyltransferase (GNAT) family protein [Mangrovibacterium diazotrophicum]
MKLEITDCKKEDSFDLLEFIRIKAEFDRHMRGFEGEISTTIQRIEETLFSDSPNAFAKFALADGVKAGFAVYYFRYSSFKGQTSVWLEDLLVLEQYRGNKLGEALMDELKREAQTKNCTHLAWTASKHNAAGIRFYEKIGARQVGTMTNTVYFKMDLE